MQSLRILVTSAVFSVVGAIGVHAASITLYSDESAFDAAVTGVITEDFSTIVSPGMTRLPSLYDFGPFTIDKQYSTQNIRANGSIGGLLTGTDGNIWTGKPSAVLGDIIVFNNKLRAWGGTFNTGYGGGSVGIEFSVVLDLLSAGEVVGSIGTGGGASNGFFGFTSDIGFDTVNIFLAGAKSDRYSMDDMKYAQISPVPLPAGMVLLGSGLVLIGGLSRRKKNK